MSDCVHYALENSTALKRVQVSAEDAERAARGATYTFIPSLNIANQHNISTGRVLDPTTYDFVTNRAVYDMSASVGGSVLLFSGGERLQQARKAKLNLQSALLETERIRNDLTLNVTALFLNLVLDKEAITLCETKCALLQAQETLIRKRVALEAATPGDLLGIQADITSAKVELTAALSNFDLDRVAMCELLEIQDWQDFDISTDDLDLEHLQPRLWDVADLVSTAYSLPQIRQGELAVEMAARDVGIASSAFWPSLRLNAGYGSTYSNARLRSDGEDYLFRDQLRDNMSSFVTLSLSIPILSAISVSNTVRQRQLAHKQAEFALTLAKLTLEKEIKQALINAQAAYDKYLLLDKDVVQCREALRQAELKFNTGTITYYDYQMAVGKLYQAEIQCLQMKYETIFRNRILEFYNRIN